MKCKLFTLVLIFTSSALYSQLSPVKTEKICVDEDENSVLNIAVQENIIILKTATGQKLSGFDLNTNEVVWTRNYPKQYYVGYGIYKYGNNIMFSSNDNKYDSKGKVTTASWIFTLDPSTGNKIDSVKLNFDAVYLSDSPGKSGVLGVIRMGSDNKYYSSLISKSNGKVYYELFKEDSKTGSIPNCIAIDQNEKFAAVGTANGKSGFFLYDFSSGKQLLNLPGAEDIHSIVFSSDGQYCFYIQNKLLNIVNTSSLKLEKQISITGDLFFTAIHNDDENLALTGFGNGAPVTFVNWKTGKMSATTINTTGMNCYFTSSGDFIAHNMKYAFSCKLDKTGKPYLVRFSFTNSAESTSGNASTTTGFEQGGRAFILYAVDKKYYSGTITEISGSVFKVIYDDGTPASVKESDLKKLPALANGMKVQCRASDKKFYWGTIAEIKGEALKINFSDGKTSGWFTKRDVMQVE